MVGASSGRLDHIGRLDFSRDGRGPTLGFHIPGLGGPGLCRSGSLYLV